MCLALLPLIHVAILPRQKMFEPKIAYIHTLTRGQLTHNTKLQSRLQLKQPQFHAGMKTIITPKIARVQGMGGYLLCKRPVVAPILLLTSSSKAAGHRFDWRDARLSYG